MVWYTDVHRGLIVKGVQFLCTCCDDSHKDAIGRDEHNRYDNGHVGDGHSRYSRGMVMTIA